MQHSIGKCDIRSGLELKMKITLSRRRRLARVNDDPAPAVVALLPEEFVEHRKSLGAVCASDEQDFCERDVAPRIRRAVNAERLVVAGSSRDHAEPPVVINVARLKSCPRELAHKVSLLRRQRRAGIDAY